MNGGTSEIMKVFSKICYTTTISQNMFKISVVTYTNDILIKILKTLILNYISQGIC